MSDRFDLEQSILNCWNITDDILALADIVDQGDTDRILNGLIGLSTIYSIKFEKLFEIFSNQSINDVPYLFREQIGDLKYQIKELHEKIEILKLQLSVQEEENNVLKSQQGMIPFTSLSSMPNPDYRFGEILCGAAGKSNLDKFY